MALNAEVVVITQPGATGNQTYNLATGFAPKAIIAFTTGRTASGGGQAHALHGYGFGTYRVSAVQQIWVYGSAENVAATSDTYRGFGSDALIKMGDGLTGTVDLEIDLVSLATDSLTLNWVNLHSTASVQVACILIGGSDVEDALAGSFTSQITPATQDVTVAAGFGQPSVVGFARSVQNLTTTISTGWDTCIGWGVKQAGANGRSVRIGSQDNAATEASYQRIDNANAMHSGFNGAQHLAFGMSASSAWPTDGFEISYTAQAVGEHVGYLALKLSADVTVTHGQGAAPITGSPPVAQTLASSGTPKLALIMAARTATANTTDSTSGDAAFAGIGAIDGAGAVAFAAASDDDGQATAAVAGSYWSTAKALQHWLPSSNAITSEADGVVSGSNFELSWTDIDATAYLYEWLTLGEPAAAGVVLDGILVGASSADGVVDVARTLAGAASAGASAACVADVSRPLAGSAPAASAAAATLGVNRVLAGVASSAGAAAAELAVTRSLSAGASAAAAAAAALAADRSLSGAAAAAAAASGSLSITGQVAFTGVGEAAATAAGSLAATRQLAGAAGQAAAASSSLAAARAFTGSAASVSASSGLVATLRSVSGSAALASSASAALAVSRPMAGTVAAAGGSAASLEVARPLAGTAAAAAGAVAALAIAGQVTFSGSAAAASSMSGALDVARSLAGSIPAAGSVTAGLATALALAGTSPATAAAAADLACARGLSAVLAAASGASGVLTVSSETVLTGTASAASAGSGALVVMRSLSGTGPAAAGAVAAVAVQRGLAALAAAAGHLTGLLTVARPLAGAAAAAGSAVGDLTSTPPLVAGSACVIERRGPSAAGTSRAAATAAQPGLARVAAAAERVRAGPEVVIVDRAVPTAVGVS